MSLPRRVLPGETYLLTRRCYQRTFRLRPSDSTTAIFKYCLALAAQKTGVIIHAVCVMSNHHHLVVTDPLGQLPDFLRELHRTTAKALNASQGQWENLWSSEQPNAVRLGDGEDVARKMAYVATNPVDAGLVADPSDWPGLNVWETEDLVVERPLDYFSPRGEAPERLTLRIEPPPHASLPGTPFRERLKTLIADRIAAASRAVNAAGLTFLGCAAVLGTSFIARAKSYEVKRGMVPTVAASDPGLRAGLLRARNAFLIAYDSALARWRQGVREAVFPAGTWWMRVHHGAAVDAPAPARPAPA
jgi:putative transposase